MDMGTLMAAMGLLMFFVLWLTVKERNTTHPNSDDALLIVCVTILLATVVVVLAAEPVGDRDIRTRTDGPAVEVEVP